MYGVLKFREPSKENKLERWPVGPIWVQGVWIDKGQRTPPWLVGYRVKRAVRYLQVQGITQGIYPPEMAVWAEGVSPVSTVALGECLASVLLVDCLQDKQISPAQATVGLVADRITLRLGRTLEHMALHHRHVLLEVPGGEDLCQHLRRRYGVAIQCNLGAGALQRCDGVVAFAPMEGVKATVSTYEKELVLPTLCWPSQWPCPREVSPLQGWAMVANTETWQENWTKLALINREFEN